MEHYLCIHVGPVQDFIKSARRCRDLWFGSYLLSEVSKAAARGLHQEGKVPLEKFVFPAPREAVELNSGSSLTVANRVVALAENPERAAAAAQRACRAQLLNLWEKTRQLRQHLDEERARQQLDDLLEFYWAAAPLSGGYPSARALAERLLAARKNTRLFGPATWAHGVEKSSLDGQRERVLDLRGLSEQSLRRWGLRPGENLCGIGVLKRLGSMHGDYRNYAALSTSHVASRSWQLQHLNDAGVVAAYEQTLLSCGIQEEDLRARDGQLDGHVLYPERLVNYVQPDRQSEAISALNQLVRRAGSRPTPYYAVLQADGDRMGATIDNLDFTKQRALTQVLSSFAADDVRKLVQQHHGYLIYAGGDDVLAMLPVEQVLPCAQKLSRQFARCLQPFGKELTLSVGVAIRHHLEPLQETLEAARRAEKKAKESRNALAISLDKRGGTEVLVTGQWAELDLRLSELTSISGFISHGFAYELRELAATTGETGDMAVREGLRIALRKRGEQGSLNKQQVETLRKQLCGGISRVSNELIVSRFLRGDSHAPVVN